MAVYYSKEKVEEITLKYGKGIANDTGNTEVQVALLTYRIECLSAHLRINKKDHATRRALVTMVGQRKSLLQYYMRRDIFKYRALIEKLGLRK
jgi:small subunit ribosomal protein S15